MKEFNCHSRKQNTALFSNKKIVLCATGIQWGKTSIGAVWMRKHIHAHWSPNNNFLVTSPTYKIMKQSTLPAFLNIMGGLGRYNGTDATYTIKDGPTVYFRSGTHPDSVVGLTNVEAIWSDEAGKYSLYFWENIQARSSFRGCPVIITTSPYSLNWIYKELITAVQKGKRLDEIELIQAASYENPYFPKAEYERKKKTMDPRRFNMVYGGEWGKHEGLVYDCFSADEMEIDPYQFPSGTKFYGGIDWGHRDPFVLIVRAITPYGYKIEVSETYRPGLRPSQIKEILIQKHNLYNVQAFFADPSRPDLIAELQVDKIPVIGADNSIQKGIDLHYELIKSGNYKIIRGSCPNLIDEYETYHYSEEKDLQPDQNSYKSKEIPVDQSNHAMDACRYLTVGTHTSNIKLQPKLPDVFSKNKFKFHD